MTKVVDLAERRGTFKYKDGDVVKSLKWIFDYEKPAQDIEDAIHDLLFKYDQESIERARNVLGDAVGAYKLKGERR